MHVIRVVESVGAGYSYVKHHYPRKIELVNGLYVFNSQLVHRVPSRGV